MRPSQKASEERKWVIDAVNKYFDVIVEEEEEEEDEEFAEESENESDDEEIESLSDIDYQESEDEIEESEDDYEEEVDDKAARSEFRSTAKIRGLLSTALTKMSSSRGDLSEMSQLPSDEKQGLLNNLKQRLGSQISLKRRSQDFLNAI